MLTFKIDHTIPLNPNSKSKPLANRYTLYHTQIMEKLTNTNKNFKYIIHVILLAKGGNGLDMGGLTYWNPEMDGNVNVKWDSKFLTCITTVYGIAN